MHRFDVEDRKAAIRAELVRLADELGRTPTMNDYGRLQSVGVGLHQVTYLYGRYSSAVTDAGLTPNASQQPPRAAAISESDLVDDFVRVANELGKVPGGHLFRSRSRYSWTPYKTRWGSWAAAKAHILENYSGRLHFDITAPVKRRAAASKRRALGIECALLHRPTNELETIALFCMLCPELGYRVKALSAAFPDAILEKDGQELDVEFEFLSSNYLQHCHPLDFGGICICWRRDTDIPGVQILALEEYVRTRDQTDGA